MKWVTWENVAVDRIACAWLIRRFIDREAEFIFIPSGHKPMPIDAEPFDIPGAKYSHHMGHSTFYTLVLEYGFKDPILQRIARIIDEADVIQEAAVELAAPGLDLICRGLRRISLDDPIVIERGALIYEAIYAELEAENFYPET